MLGRAHFKRHVRCIQAGPVRGSSVRAGEKDVDQEESGFLDVLDTPDLDKATIAVACHKYMYIMT